MKILFNLAHQRNALTLISENDVGTAFAILTKVCLDNGYPVVPSFYDPNLSFEHSVIYENVKSYAEAHLFSIPTPNYAHLADLGNLQFQLTLHN